MSRSHERQTIPGGNISGVRNLRIARLREPAESSATGRAGLNRSVTPIGPRSLISLPLRVKRAALKNKVLDRELQASRLLEFLHFRAIFHPSTHYMWGRRFRLPTRSALGALWLLVIF